MRILLDTHTFLWFLQEPDRLPKELYKEIEASAAYVSIGSLWEITIKVSNKKLILSEAFTSFEDALNECGVVLLPIGLDHLETLRTLPHHHKDPFDRLLIAQAISEALTIATLDPIIAQYPVPTRWEAPPGPQRPTTP